MDLNIFAASFIEPGSSSVALLLSSTFSGDEKSVSLSQDCVLMYDPVLRRSVCAKQEAKWTMLSCHKGQCLGPNVCSCFKAMEHFKRCGTVAGTKSMPIAGEFLAIFSTETSIVQVSNNENSGLNIRYFTPGEHFFYIRKWNLAVVPMDFESCSGGVGSPEIIKGMKCKSDMPENLENAGVQWLHGRDSAEVTDYILDYMFQHGHCDIVKTDVKKHGVSILRAGNITTLWYQPSVKVCPLVDAKSNFDVKTKSLDVVRRSPFDLHASTESPSTVLGLTLPAPTRSRSPAATLKSQSTSSKSRGKKRSISSISTGNCTAAPVPKSLTNIKPPKGYISAFNYYVQGNRQRVLTENPALEHNNNDLNKLLGQLWKKLSVSDLKQYLDLAAEDKIRYCTQLDMYNQIVSKSDPSKIIIPRVNTNDSVDTATSTSTNSSEGCALSTDSEWSVASESLIYRPRSAYSHFTRQEKQFVTALGDKMKLQCVMGKYFAARWSFMNPEQKELYKLLEDDDKIEAKTLHMSKMKKV